MTSESTAAKTNVDEIYSSHFLGRRVDVLAGTPGQQGIRGKPPYNVVLFLASCRSLFTVESLSVHVPILLIIRGLLERARSEWMVRLVPLLSPDVFVGHRLEEQASRRYSRWLDMSELADIPAAYCVAVLFIIPSGPALHGCCEKECYHVVSGRHC